MMSSNSTSLGLVTIWGNDPSTSLVTSSQLVIPVSGKHLCCVWYCCANCQHFQLGKACSERKLPSLGRWTAITVVSQWINRRKPVAVWFCAARMAVSMVVNFLVHTHPNTWFLPWAMPSPGVAGCFPVGCLVHPRMPFSPVMSPGALHLPTVNLLQGFLPPWAAVWECLPALPSLPHLAFGYLGRSCEPGLVTNMEIMLGLREAALKQVHLTWSRADI